MPIVSGIKTRSDPFLWQRVEVILLMKLKRTGVCILCMLFLLSVLLPAFAAEGESLGTLRVCNCNEWVSLRARPKTSADRIMKVPLGALVTNCTRANDKFAYCEYEGRSGYILLEYLEKASAEEQASVAAEAKPVIQGDAMIEIESLAERSGAVTAPPVVSQVCGASYLELMSSGGECVMLENLTRGDTRCVVCAVILHPETGGETLTCAVFDPNLQLLWARRMDDAGDGQYEALSAFRGGPEEAPCLMLYKAGQGLQALDLLTGDELWLLPYSDVRLGASICHALERDGTLYIAGADGPHPVAISSRGTLLWRSDPGDPDIYGPYRITLMPEGIYTDYESRQPGSGRGHHAVLYDYYGGVKSVDIVH